MKILKIYISKNNGQNKEIELVVNDYTTEDLAEEIARKGEQSHEFRKMQ